VHHGGGLGGAPVSLVKLLAALPGRELESSLIVTEPGNLVTYAGQQGVAASVVHTGGALFASAHARVTDPRMLARFVRTFPSAVQQAQQTLRVRRPHVLHLNTSVLLAWAAAARREGVPVVWMVREVLHLNPIVRQWQASYIQSHARRVVAISDAVRACFPPAAQVERVHNAVDLREFDLALLQQAASVRSALGLHASHHVLMAIGSVQRAKGHWLLLEALERLRDLPDIRLVLVCGGADLNYRHSLRGRVKAALGRPMDNLDALLRDAARLGVAESIIVTGFRSDVARVLTAADVVVFPSLAAEGFGRPIIEAMAMTRPVVATDVGPSLEVLGPQAGVLVPPRADAVAMAVRDLLASPTRRTQLGQAGRARVEACFGLDRQVAAMSAIYREVGMSA
jgi:glycosyltransferase involved in cell wall biosynthesis